MPCNCWQQQRHIQNAGITPEGLALLKRETLRSPAKCCRPACSMSPSLALNSRCFCNKKTVLQMLPGSCSSLHFGLESQVTLSDPVLSTSAMVSGCSSGTMNNALLPLMRAPNMWKCDILGLRTCKRAGAHLDCQGRPILFVLACLTLLLSLQLLAPARQDKCQILSRQDKRQILSQKAGQAKACRWLPLHATGTSRLQQVQPVRGHAEAEGASRHSK